MVKKLQLPERKIDNIRKKNCDFNIFYKLYKILKIKFVINLIKTKIFMTIREDTSIHKFEQDVKTNVKSYEL